MDDEFNESTSIVVSPHPTLNMQVGYAIRYNPSYNQEASLLKVSFIDLFANNALQLFNFSFHYCVRWDRKFIFVINEYRS